MNTIKQLIHEIHRRSLWQVLSIFVAASWGVLQVVEVVTESAGLPDWTPSMALVLLLVGLPICLATAFVQEGMPGRPAEGPEGTTASDLADAEPEVEAVNLASGTGSLDRPSTRPSRSKRLLTWRRAFIGGAAAAVLLVGSLVGYFVMWSSGIGPLGNLVAQGVIEEGAWVVLADFEDSTGEGLGTVVKGALRVDLAESPVLNLIDDADIAPALERMRVEPGTPLTSALALEVAVRDGIEAVLEGTVAPAGTGYLITAALVEAQSGRTVATFRATAADDSEIIATIDKLSQDIREKSGESLRQIKAGEPLEQTTTTSLAALRAYTEAATLHGTTQTTRITDLLEGAVAIDSTFATAWILLATHLSNNGLDFPRASEASEAAFRHRHQVSERARYFIEGSYYMWRGENDLALEAHQSYVRLRPEYWGAFNQLAVVLMFAGEWERAAELLRQALDLPVPGIMAYQNLVDAELFLGNTEQAAAVLADFDRAFPNAAGISERKVNIALLLGAPDRAEELAAAVWDDPTQPPLQRIQGAMSLANVAGQRGQLAAAREYRAQAIQLADLGAPDAASFQRVMAVTSQVFLGDSVRAGRQLIGWLQDGSLELASLPLFDVGPLVEILVVGGVDRSELEAVYVEAGGVPDDVAAAWTGVEARLNDPAGVLAVLDQRLQAAGCRTDHCALITRALLSSGAGEYDAAIDLFERLSRRGAQFSPLTGMQTMDAKLQLGSLYEAAGRTDEAVAAYQRVVDMWVDADEEGQVVVRRYQERIRALAGG